MEELQKIDAIRERMNVTYEKAKWALDQSNGDLLNALVFLEKESRAETREFNVCSKDLLTKVRELIQAGNVTRLKIKHKGKVMLEIPLTAGVAGGAVAITLSPLWTTIAVTAGLFTHWTIEVERRQKRVDSE
jgi:hypothetical protein